MAAGLIDALPFAPSVLTLGAIFGASTGPAGISPPAAILMSVLVISGAAQFAALPLWPQGGAVVVLSVYPEFAFTLITTSLASALTSRPPLAAGGPCVLRH